MDAFPTRRPAFLDPTLWVVGLLGMASGLPLALTASTLGAWLKDEGISKTSIGLFAAVGVPYALKFLWAPLMDGARLPLFARLGRRRGWLLFTQLLLVAAMAGMSRLEPASAPGMVALAGLFLAAVSATQDIVIDAYRTERLNTAQLGAGVTMTQLGYRVGMLVSGAGALLLADRLGWQASYLCMAALMACFLPLTLAMAEPVLAETPRAVQGASAWLRDYVAAPFLDFMRQPGWWALLLFVITYKLGDAFLGVMTNPFLLEIGFSKTQIAGIVKLFGTGATLLGIVAVAACMARFRMFTLLWSVGLLHAITNGMFLLQARVGADPTLYFRGFTTGESMLALSIGLENFTGALSSGVFVVFISRLCHARYTATQYALLSALAAFGRTVLSTSGGKVADAYGWAAFFVLCMLFALPSLGVLWWLRKRGLLPAESN